MPKPRSEKMLIAAAAKWCRAVRNHFQWSVEDLARECDAATEWLRFANAIPTKEDIETLEAEQVKRLPRWLRSARYAVERAELSSRSQEAWPLPRTWFTYDYTGGDAFDCSYPLVFRDEYYFFEDLNQMAEDDRRALRRFTSAWLSPYPNRKDVVERLLSDFGVTFEQEVADPVESDLLHNARKLSSSAQQMLLVMSEDPQNLKIVAQYVDRMRAADATIAELIDLSCRMDEDARSTVMAVARLAVARSR